MLVTRTNVCDEDVGRRCLTHASTHRGAGDLKLKHYVHCWNLLPLPQQPKVAGGRRAGLSSPDPCTGTLTLNAKIYSGFSVSP